ncbi:MAG: erythromycin esterase family protein [Thermomicrobiales bacterium]
MMKTSERQRTAVRYHDRRQAGEYLGTLLRKFANRSDVIVLALPRGGVPVGYEVADALNAPFDVFLVRKLGVPGHEEFAFGAIASGGVRVINEEVVQALGISDDVIEAVAAAEQRELSRRERLYWGSRPLPDVGGRTAILVDDGLATGSTMHAAAEALRAEGAARVVAAVPVGSPAVCEALGDVVDDIVCGTTPEPFYAVGLWYDEFGQTSDEEVQSLLAKAQERELGASSSSDPTATSRSASVPSVSREVDAVRRLARPFAANKGDYDAVLELIGDARYVLVGEASHGTHEFYQERAELTKRLIVEKGFTAVAAEADWPDAYRVNRYVRAASNDANSDQALSDFKRFPQWMWRNTVVLDFVEWLRSYNDGVKSEVSKAGFYGLDLYSLHASIEAVIGYLERVDPEAAGRARRRYACFDHFGDDAQMYGYATSMGAAEPCEDEVVNQLVELQRRAAELAQRDGFVAEDEFFFAEQNARLAKNAEAYYRSMFRGRISSWNLRDQHMAETLDALVAHLSKRSKNAKVVVWAHNSHLGDARATQMGVEGELNLGQLVRERHADESFLAGFSTNRGTVSAASDWGAPVERKRVRPGLRGSYEDLFHDVGSGEPGPRFFLPLGGQSDELDQLRQPRLQRAIGVIYRPETERFSHYFLARLADQFDLLMHIDESTALEPLEWTAGWEAGEPPETYPFQV